MLNFKKHYIYYYFLKYKKILFGNNTLLTLQFYK